MIPSCLKEEIIMSSQRKAEAVASENIVTTETSSLSDLWKKRIGWQYGSDLSLSRSVQLQYLQEHLILMPQNSAPGVMEQVF